jgi:hypothetical protein
MLCVIYAECHIKSCMLSDVMLSVVMAIVVAPILQAWKQFFVLHWTKLFDTLIGYGLQMSTWRRDSWHNDTQKNDTQHESATFSVSECRLCCVVVLNVPVKYLNMLSVVMVNVVILIVVAPPRDII